jgi:hypothetical protein
MAHPVDGLGEVIAGQTLSWLSNFLLSFLAEPHVSAHGLGPGPSNGRKARAAGLQVSSIALRRFTQGREFFAPRSCHATFKKPFLYGLFCMAWQVVGYRLLVPGYRLLVWS